MNIKFPKTLYAKLLTEANAQDVSIPVLIVSILCTHFNQGTEL